MNRELPRTRIDFDQSLLAVEVSSETAPLPFFRARNQASLHRIPMHVAKLLDSLLFGAHIEVVKPLLPYGVTESFVFRSGQVNRSFTTFMTTEGSPMGRVAQARSCAHRESSGAPSKR